MSSLLDRMKDRGFTSKDKLALAVLERWQKKEKGSSRPKPRSLGAKIGELERGQAVWWHNHPGAAEALAEVLDADIEELLPSRPVQEEKVFNFADFPQLRPFDPRHESPCDLATVKRVDSDSSISSSPFRWFDEDPRLPFCTWLEVPPGMGLSFLGHWHQQRGIRVYKASTLSAANLVAGKEPVVVVVRNPEPEHDEEWLFQHRKQWGLLILAPFPLPVTKPEISLESLWNRTWSTHDLDPVTRRRLALTGRLSALHKARLVLVPDWRRRVINWIVERTPRDTLFSPEPFLEWLERFDLEERLLATPGDLLPFCAYAHRNGEKKLRTAPRRNFSEQWLQQLIEHTTAGLPQASWLKNSGVETLRQAIIKRWHNASIPWQGGLTKELWAGLIPPVQLSQRTEVEGGLLQVVNLRNRKERERKAREIAHQLREPPEIAFDYLCDAGLLRAGAPGQWMPHPRWAVNLQVQEEILRVFKEEEPYIWGHWYASAERRPLLDAVLDQLTEAEFLSLLNRCYPDTPDNPEQVMDILKAQVESIHKAGEDAIKAAAKAGLSLLSPTVGTIKAPPKREEITPTEETERELGETGVVEALFSAGARRMERGWRPVEEKRSTQGFQAAVHLRRIEIRLRVFARKRGRPPLLSSLLRWGVSEGQPEGLRWLGDCWAWSLWARKQWRFVPPWEPWMFPGRQEELLREIPEWLFTYGAGPVKKESSSKEVELSLEFQRLLRLSLPVLKRSRPVEEFPEKLPDILLPGALLLAARDEVRIRRAHLKALEERPWAVQFFLQQLPLPEKEENQRLAGKLWGAFIELAPVLRMHSGLDDLLTFTLQHLTEERLFASLEVDGIRAIFGDPFVLPPRLRLAAVCWLEKHQPQQLPIFLLRPEELTRDDLESLWILAGHFPQCAWHARAALWRLEPQLSLQKTRDALAGGDQKEASWWYWAAPRPQLTALLELLENLPPGPQPDWIPAWLEMKLPEGDMLTGRIFRLWHSFMSRLS